MVFHWSLSDSKSPQFPRTQLSILDDLNSVVVCMVFILPLISSSPIFFPGLWKPFHYFNHYISCMFFQPLLTGSFSLKSEWQQISLIKIVTLSFSTFREVFVSQCTSRNLFLVECKTMSSHLFLCPSNPQIWSSRWIFSLQKKKKKKSKYIGCCTWYWTHLLQWVFQWSKHL